MTDSSGEWVYAIAEHADQTGLGDVAGVGAGPVHTVEAAGLTAVTQTVPLGEFGEAALRRNLEDLDWLEGVARAHHAVIGAVARQGPLVPMRLATVYRTEASLKGMLEEHGSEFREALRRIGTRKEWGVKIYATPESGQGGAQRERAAGRAAARPGSQARGTGAGAGAAYLRRRRDELSAAKETRRSAMASTRAVHDQLSRLAGQARLHPPQAPQLTGSKEPMLLNAAYLLDDAEVERFRAAVAALAKEHPGIRLQMNGPWPPYSFTGTDDGNDDIQRTAAS